MGQRALLTEINIGNKPCLVYMLQGFLQDEEGVISPGTDLL